MLSAHVHNCTLDKREREANHHKMTQDQIKRRVELLWLMRAQKRAMGASACETVCIAHTLACTFAFPCPLIWFSTANKRGIKGIRRELERERAAGRGSEQKKTKGDDICYINISRSFDRIILHLPRLSCFISVLEFRGLKIPNSKCTDFNLCVCMCPNYTVFAGRKEVSRSYVVAYK